MNAIKLNVLCIGLEPETSRLLADLFKKCQVETISMNEDVLLTPSKSKPALVLCGMPKSEIKPNELAQALRMLYLDLPLYLCSEERSHFERKESIYNGFTDAFLMPTDLSQIRAILEAAIAKATPSVLQSYRAVKIIDLEAGLELDFDTNLFLPANNKYLKLSHAGDALDAGRLDKIQKSKFSTVYVPSQHMQKFYDYTAKRLRHLGTDTFRVTERKEKLGLAVRELMSGLFTEESATFESGQAILKDCGEIVKTYILQGADTEWYARILTTLGERGDTYSHASNTSTLAALFSMGLGIGKPEDLALAGLLHDIGLAELPVEIQMLEPEEMTDLQFSVYKHHPELSVQLIKSRKLIVPEIVSKAILQHHENYNGTGYPSGLFGSRIEKESQVLALANTFDYMTSIKPGRPMLTPMQAVQKLRSEQINDPSQIKYNPEILKRLLTLFPMPETQAVRLAHAN